MRLLISLLNHIPTPLASRFRRESPLGRALRAILSRTGTGNVIAVVRSGHGRGMRLPLDPTQEKYYWAGQHDVPVQDVLMRVVRPGAVVWDIGAHIGFFTILASQRAGSSGHVHAFEPMPRNRERLEKTIQLNHAANVSVHGVAVSGTDGSALLHAHATTAMWTLVAERGER
ncbi:MAG: hypothetical protein QOI52_551, partial [Chloroflexota bacterium]|nr:hypothetical protein [Chloroflexota bacterium]